MIVTETKPFGIIKAKLKKDEEVSIVSCNHCAKLCGTGGKQGLKEMKERLEGEEYTVCDEFVLAPACDKNTSKKIVKPGKSVVLALTCDAGVAIMKQLFKDNKVAPALDTVGLGAYDEEGNIFLIKKFE